MARTRRQLHKGRPPVLAPSVSFRTIVFATMGFVSFIGLLIAWSATNSNRNKNSSMSLSNRFDTSGEIPDSIIINLDAVLVLGGGLPTNIDEPPLFVQRRCNDAAQVVQRYQSLAKERKRLPVLCLSAGTAHLPQLLSADGLPIFEATSSAAYLLKHHSNVIDKSQVYVETTSYDTIGNAFFARTSFTDIGGWRNLLIVTNEFHMNRTQVIFDWIFGLDAAALRDNDNNDGTYHLMYLSPPNTGLSDTAVQARKEREAKSQRTVETILSKKYRSMREVWIFLTKEHSLYSASKLVERGRGSHDAQVDESVKASYGLSNRKAPTDEEKGGTDSL